MTQHQGEALDLVLVQVRHGTPLCSLQGMAGTGKTTVIPHLVAGLHAAGYYPVVATPTHRAAAILRAKGLEDVDTIHARALTPKFAPEYTEARYWLGEPTGEGDDDGDEAQGDGPVPALLRDALSASDETRTAEDLLEEAQFHGSVAVLESLGIHGRDYITGFVPKPMQARGVIIVDEASMVGRELLNLCQQVYRQIILVGDPAQLPPVKDEPVLLHTPAIMLTEIHRQAAESRLIDLAYRARRGYAFWRWGLHQFAPDVQEVESAPAQAFLTAPLLVWRNNVRVACTRQIRTALGYPATHLVAGEPLLCRASHPAQRQDGYYNNALFRVREVDGGSRRVVLTDEVTGASRYVTIHVEELDGDRVPYGAIPFRLGYVMTCHTAQGGEWPTVYVSQSDLAAFAGYAWHNQRLDDLHRWTYTAVTRAQTSLGLLQTHTFEVSA